MTQRVFRQIGPALRHLTIQSLNDLSSFIYSPRVLENLMNATLAVGLLSLTILDRDGTWATIDVASIRR